MTQINTLTSFTVFSTPSFGAQALEIIRFRIRARSAVPTRMIRSAVVQICQKKCLQIKRNVCATKICIFKDEKFFFPLE